MSRRAAGGTEQVFGVLTVCLGNICRSPLAEQLIRARAAEAGIDEIEVASAGLRAVVGAPMEPKPAELSLAFGGEPAAHRGTQLDDAHADAADLILTMTRNQRDEVVRRYPRAAQRTFTIVEFVRLLGIVSPPASPVPAQLGSAEASAPLATRPATAERLRELVSQAARRRASVRLTADDDVVDPMGRSDAVHEAVAEQLSLATSRLVFALR